MTRLIWSNEAPVGRRPPAALEASIRPEAQALRAGAPAPGFRLPNQAGRRVALRDLLAEGPVVLRFCGQDGAAYVRELDGLAAVNTDIERLGATLAVIAGRPFSPRAVDTERAAYDFLILMDKGSTVARSYGLTSGAPPTAAARGQTPAPGRRGPAASAPATYVIDRESVVALSFVDPEDRTRMAPEQIVTALDCLNRRPGPPRGGPVGP